MSTTASEAVEAKSVRYVWPLDGKRADESRHYLTYGREQDYLPCPLADKESDKYAEAVAAFKQLGLDARLLHHRYKSYYPKKGRCSHCGHKLKSLGWATWEERTAFVDLGFGVARHSERVEGSVRWFDTQREAKADAARRGQEEQETAQA